MHHLTASGVKFSLVRFTSTKAEVKCTSFLNLSNHRCQNGVLEYLLSSSVLPSLIPQFCKKVPVFECSNACNELTVRLMQVIFNQQNGNVESCTQLCCLSRSLRSRPKNGPKNWTVWSLRKRQLTSLESRFVSKRFKRKFRTKISFSLSGFPFRQRAATTPFEIGNIDTPSQHELPINEIYS